MNNSKNKMDVGKIYMTDLSGPVRSVLLAAKALGIQLEKCEINLQNGDQLKPEYVKLNPQHTVPMYIDQDGSKIWDSHAIMAYLVSKYGKTDELYPKDLFKRAVVDQRLHFDSGNLFPYLKIIFNGIMREGWSLIPSNVIEVVHTQYDFVNQFLCENNWVAGGNITIADFSIFSSISALEVFVPIDYKKYTKIGKWLKCHEQLPCYSEHLEGFSKFKGLICEILKQKNITL